jgi:glycosyltransferase involved in cell wall biosynthesis
LKVVILAHYFQEADAPGISLLGSLADHLASSSHTVSVVCGRRVRMGRSIAPRFTRTATGYDIHRTWSGNEASFGIASRILSFIAFTVSALFGLVKAGRADVVFASSPPIFPMLTAWLWARLTRAKFVLEVCDLWPDSVIALGVVKSRPLIWLTRRLELFLYNHSDAIVALTDGVAETVRERLTTNIPVHVAVAAVPLEAYRSAAADRPAIRERMGWHGKTVAIFAGTTGYAQDIGTLVSAAERLRDVANLLVVVVGSGPEWSIAEEGAARLPNLVLLPPVAKHEMVGLLAAADIGLCTLRNHPLFDGALPTKLIDYLAADLPVVAAAMKAIVEVAANRNVRLYVAENPASLEAELRKLAHDLMTGLSSRWQGETNLPAEYDLSNRNAGLEIILSRVAAAA